MTFQYTDNQKRTNINVISEGDGIECVYIQIDDRVGLKLYKTLEEATEARKFQFVASVFYIGPDVYSQVVHLNVDPDSPGCHWGFLHDRKEVWGYYTEIVLCLRDLPERNYAAELRELKRTARVNMDWQITDDHSGNLGIKNGKMVFIDFGKISNFYSEEDIKPLYARYGIE